MSFTFTPPDGYRDTTSFPTKPANETEFRNSMQNLLDQLRDELNLGASSAVGLQNIHRQAIINGNFDISQRGTSFLNPGTPQYTLDRYFSSSSPDGGTFPNITHTRNSLTPGELDGSFYSYKIDWDGIGSSLGTNSSYGIFTRIESGTRLLCGTGKQVTISIYARSPIAGKKIGVSVSQRYGTGGSPSANELLGGQVFTLDADFQRLSLTVDTETLTGKTFGTNINDYLQIGFLYEWGTSTAATFGLTGSEGFGLAGFVDIAQIQVNSGSSSLSFQARSIAEELHLCQRYYEKSYNLTSPPGSVDSVGSVSWISTGGNFAETAVFFKVRKRTNPTVTIYSPVTGSSGVLRNVSTAADIAAATDGTPGEYGFAVTPNNVATTLGNTLRAHFTADAEL